MSCWMEGTARAKCAAELCCGGGNVAEPIDKKNKIEMCGKKEAAEYIWKDATPYWTKTAASMEADALAGKKDPEAKTETLKFHCIEGA